MAKKSGRKKPKGKRETGEKEPEEQAVVTGGIEMRERRSMVLMSVLTLLLVLFVTWRLEPTLGLGKALLIGAAFAVAWLAFVLSYFIYNWLRSRRSSDE
jgi:hypothetical protein